MSHRTVLRTHAAVRDDIADLVTRRPLPGPGLPQVDPFLFLNHHGPQVYAPNNQGMPFGPHPHRGFETVTFILEGSLCHADSGGHQSVIEAGGVQWMTAGSGVVHSEVLPDSFRRDGGAMEILQLWVNLPARLKMVAPRYTGVQRDALPVLSSDEGRVRLALAAGEMDGRTGPIPSLTGVFMSILTLAPGGHIVLPAPAARNVFLYTVRGEAIVSGTNVPQWHLARLAGDGDTVEIASPDGATLLFGHADPIGEPVVAHGPFVMNSEAEIVQAIRDYPAGRFEALPA